MKPAQLGPHAAGEVEHQAVPYHYLSQQEQGLRTWERNPQEKYLWSFQTRILEGRRPATTSGLTDQNCSGIIGAQARVGSPKQKKMLLSFS